MPRFLAPLLLLCLTFNAHADSYITRLLNKPVPGGVAVVDRAPRPRHRKPVIKENRCWWSRNRTIGWRLWVCR